METNKSQSKNERQESKNRKTYSDVSSTNNYSDCCFGKCRITDIKRYFLLHLLLVLGLVNYFVVCASYSHLSLIVLSGIFYGLVFISLVVLAFVDPGIIPKIIPQYQQPKLKNIPPIFKTKPQNPQNAQKSQKQQQYKFNYVITVNNFISEINYCYQCSMYQPPRTVHCYFCQACMKRRDHHCPWIGTCVAKNNYKYFLAYITLSSIFLGLILGQCIYALKIIRESGLEDKIVHFVFNIIQVIASCFGFVFTTWMLFFNILLIQKELTTYQFWMKTWQGRVNPYQKSGCMKNFQKILKAPITIMIDPATQLITRRRHGQYIQQITEENLAEKQITVENTQN